MTEVEESSFAGLQKNITAALVSTTRTAGLLANEDLDFIRTSDPDVGAELDEQTARFLASARRLARFAVKGTDVSPPTLSNADDLEDQWKGVVDIIDGLLEKADTCLDEYTGKVKKTSVPEATPLLSKKSKHVTRVQNILKPQQLFGRKPDNHNNGVFKPLLRKKPHATVPLEESISPAVQDGSSTETNGAERQSYRHPYEQEIKDYRYPPRVYTTSEPVMYQPYETTTATWVDTIDGVLEMLAELKEATEIAVDLEHHELRSYVGLVSLMQISTRDKDWIVDTLQPWREELQILNEVFANPNIIKVLHGSHLDIIWLQRDLGLYVVGLFDTYDASMSLNYTRHSLAFLLSTFANFDAQKKYQMADWRSRPLSPEMFDYARSDTHFLLYIYDNMKNELLQKANGGPALVDEVLEASKKTASQKYERFIYDLEWGTGERGWYTLFSKTPGALSKEQFSVFKAVHAWRDRVAREEDDGPSYLLNNTQLFNIARDMPSTKEALRPLIDIRVGVVRQKMQELLVIIQEAKAAGAAGPELKEVLAGHHPRATSRAGKLAYQIQSRQQAVAASDRSVATVLQQQLLVVSGENLKASNSVFWGTTVNGNKRVRLDPDASQPTITHFQVPLPAFTAEVFAAPGEVFTEQPSMPEHKYIKKSSAPAEADLVPEEGEEVFTLRGPRQGKKRKHQDDPPAEPSKLQPDYEYLDGAEDFRDDERKRRRSEKKARKRAERRATSGQSNGNGTAGDDDEAVFDYANAPPVLNAQNDSGSKGKDKSRAPVLNPYAKSMDAPKGLPKKKKELQGRTATFRN